VNAIVADPEEFTSLFAEHERKLHGSIAVTLGYPSEAMPVETMEWESLVFKRTGPD